MPYFHFTTENRDRLQHMKDSGCKVQEIAEKLNKHPSSIRREVERNSTGGVYFASKADQRSVIRRYDSKPAPKKLNATLMFQVEKRLKKRHSPQQISGRLKLDHPNDKSKQVSAETIYTWIYAKMAAGSNLRFLLRQGKRKRGKRSSGKEMRGQIVDRISIDQRPAEVQKKVQVGHWEGDTMEGSNKMGYIGTFVERKTKRLVAFPLKNKTAQSLAQATRKRFEQIPLEMRKTFTFDNGKEFADHKALTEKLGTKIYFANPYHSWERGLNEHTNGLLRQYFPKGTSFYNLTQRTLAKAVKEINNRPRKCLGYLTPEEAYQNELRALQI